jgi:hypothetical protein
LGAFWPYAGDHPIAKALNKVTKYLVTKSLGSFDWVNTQGMSGDAVEAAEGIGRAGTPHLCSRERLQALIPAELVEEFHVCLPHPRSVPLDTYHPAGLLPKALPHPGNPSDAELAPRNKLAAEDTAAAL